MDWLAILVVVVLLTGYYLWKTQLRCHGRNAMRHPDTGHSAKPGQDASPDLSSFWHGGDHP